MTTRYKNTFITKALNLTSSSKSEVLLRADFNDLGEPRQVSRAIKALIEDGYLIKIAHGVYE